MIIHAEDSREESYKVRNSKKASIRILEMEMKDMYEEFSPRMEKTAQFDNILKQIKEDMFKRPENVAQSQQSYSVSYYFVKDEKQFWRNYRLSM